MTSNERRGSRNPILERSVSYSEAIGNNSGRSSIEITSILNTEVYANEEINKHKLSQSYFEDKETVIPTNIEINRTESDSSEYSDDEHQIKNGLVMNIDVATVESSPKNSDTRHVFDASTQLVSRSTYNNVYDEIELADTISIDYLTTGTPVHGYSTPYSRRKKKGTRHKRRRGAPNRTKRVVYKNGEENVPLRSNIPAKSIKYMRDIVHTVINSKWRFIILMMVCAHFLFWFFFAFIWYAVTTSYQDEIRDGKDHCITGTSSFAGMLMMSVETQMTIGYGIRYPNEECPEAIIVMVIEIIAGTALSGGLSSLLFTKLIRPNRHVSSVGFSKKATVCLRDGELCLQFRVWDLLNVHLIGSTITAYMLKPIRTLEGEMVHNYIHQLKLKQARAFLLWPITVVHVIDAESPLYDFSAQDMIDYKFEIVVCLTGSSKNMGTVTQSRTSYLSKEIIWGHRFKNVLCYSKKQGSYVIDVDNLNSVEQVETPLCSASRLKAVEEDIKSSRNVLSTNGSLSPTYMSLNQDDTLTYKTDESLSLNRFAGTQRSFGWNFKKFPETNRQKLDQ